MSTTQAIELCKVTRTFGKGDTAVHALREVDLDVPRGDFLLVRGPSGSGKTTLLNLLSGLDQPSAGSIQVAGREITGLGDGELSRFRNQHVGYVFQAFYLESNRTALDNVALPLMFARIGGTERARRATELLERVGLADKVGVPASNLSAGQRQRVALARALVNEPALLLADEPTANLDSVTSGEILELIAEMHQRSGVTVLLVTHETTLRYPGARELWVQDGHVTEREPEPEPQPQPQPDDDGGA